MSKPENSDMSHNSQVWYVRDIWGIRDVIIIYCCFPWKEQRLLITMAGDLLCFYVCHQETNTTSVHTQRKPNKNHLKKKSVKTEVKKWNFFCFSRNHRDECPWSSWKVTRKSDSLEANSKKVSRSKFHCGVGELTVMNCWQTWWKP